MSKEIRMTNERERGKLPTLSCLRKEFKRRIQLGLTEQEAFEDVVADLLFITKTYKKACEGWERDCDKLKNKYEPSILEESSK